MGLFIDRTLVFHINPLLNGFEFNQEVALGEPVFNSCQTNPGNKPEIIT